MYQSIPAVPITLPNPPPPPRQYRTAQGGGLEHSHLLCIVGKYLFNLTAVSPMATWRTQKEKLIYCIKKPLDELP